MIVYSLLLTLALVASAPWWGWRMATSGRYREGLAGRLGVLPATLDETIARRGAAAGLIWLHAVSVGEVLAAQRLVAELQAALPGYLVVVSTTTATGQQIAREKLGGVPVFYYPLDFAFAVRRYLRALRPSLFVTVESEFWPRMLVECECAGVPVAVVNARISDRSFPRYMRLKRLWQPLLAKVTLFLTQGEETAERLGQLGVNPARIQTPGNLKFELAPVRVNGNADKLLNMLGGRKLIVAGSTLQGEEAGLLRIWPEVTRSLPKSILLIAPRHPERFEQVIESALSNWDDSSPVPARWSAIASREDREADPRLERFPYDGSVILLDTVGDLASIYALAAVAFVGGSMVPKGGHNPLEPARYGVPVVMGPHYENFREIVEGMRAQDAICICEPEKLVEAIISLATDGSDVGLNARRFTESQSGATGKTVQALLKLLEPRA